MKSTARNKMMDLLARREHSEFEITQKLAKRFSPEEVAVAIAYGKEHGWIANTEQAKQELSERAVEHLNRRKKGQMYIYNFLQVRKMKPVRNPEEVELAKALEVVKDKFHALGELEYESRMKMQAKLIRYLTARGFEPAIIRKVVAKCQK